MGFLSEDVTYLAGGLGILAGVFLVALKVTQQGKFLIWAMTALGLAGLTLVVEKLWVTDNERIEQVVYELRDAVAASNAPAVLALLTPDVQYGQWNRQDQAVEGSAARAFIESELGKVRFDFLRLSQLQSNAGSQSGRGSALFRVIAGGSYNTPFANLNFGTAHLDFALGFRRTAPKAKGARKDEAK